MSWIEWVLCLTLPLPEAVAQMNLSSLLPSPSPPPTRDSPFILIILRLPMSRFEADQLFYTSLVLELIVPQGKGSRFRKWYARFVNMARRQAGFVRADLCPPLRCLDGVVKWYSILHFDSPENLDRWQNSPERSQVLSEGQAIFSSYRYKSFTTGLEGWFSERSKLEQPRLGPPVWKQILSVVMGLYPIIMLQAFVFNGLGIMQSWSMATSMVVNNLITSSILTLAVMPQITRLLRFWLRPAYRIQSLKTDLIGALIVIAALGSMVLIFQYLLTGG